jgi:site-specific DNA-cytosine methylase
VVENVTGLLTSHEGKDFDAICAALTHAGYGLIGDGVVVPVVRFLAAQILEPLLQAVGPARRAIA